MLAAVRFDNQAITEGSEINDVSPDGGLFTKMEAECFQFT